MAGLLPRPYYCNHGAYPRQLKIRARYDMLILREAGLIGTAALSAAASITGHRVRYSGTMAALPLTTILSSTPSARRLTYQWARHATLIL